MEEIWKDIKDYEGRYQASNLGRVKSLNYRRTGKEQILKHILDKYGYPSISLCDKGIEKHHFVHKLVWEAFNGPIPEGMQVNHINEVKTDNRLENLNLMTCKENINWGTHNERMAKSQSKMVEQHTLDGTQICTWFSIIGIEKELGYSRGSISSCCSGRLKTAYGYVWKYAQ